MSTVATPSAPQLPSAPGGSLRALALSTAAFALCFTAWGLIAPLAPAYRVRYGLSLTAAGVLVAVPVLLGALLRIPIGMLTERYGARVVFPLLALSLVVPLVLAALSSSFIGLLLAALLLGTAGASFVVGIPFVAAWFPPRLQGLALGIYGAGNIGTGAAAFFAPRLAEAWGLAAVFWLFVPLMVACAALFWAFAREAPAFSPRRATLAERTRVLTDRPVVWVLVLFYFVCFGGFVAIGSFLPSLLVASYDLTPTDAGGRAAGFVLLATLGRPFGGWLGDRFGGARTLNGVFVAVALFAVVLAFEPAMAGITVGFLGAAAALGIGSGAVFKLVADLFPKEAGTVAGIVGAAGGLGGFFPPLVLGVVRDLTGSYAIAFMLLSEFSLACLIVNLLVLQGHSRRFAAETPAL